MSAVIKLPPVVLILIAISLGAVGQLVLKKGMNDVGEIVSFSWSLFAIFLKPAILAGCAAYGLSMCLWLVVLSKVDLSYAYPFVSLNYVVVFFFSWLLFKEDVNIWRWIGIGCICAGVILIARMGGEGKTAGPEGIKTKLERTVDGG